MRARKRALRNSSSDAPQILSSRPSAKRESRDRLMMADGGPGYALRAFRDDAIHCSRDASAPEASSGPSQELRGDGAPSGALSFSTPCGVTCLARHVRHPALHRGVCSARAALSCRRLRLCSVGKLRSSVSQAPGRRSYCRRAEPRNRPVPCLRGTTAGAASRSADRTPPEGALDERDAVL